MRPDTLEDPWPHSIALGWLQSFPIYWLRRDFLLREGFVRPGTTVLEAGSGPAHDSLVFAENDAAVIALDISLKGLEGARYIYRDQGCAIQTVVGSIFSLPFLNGSFDLTWNAGTLEHFHPATLKSALAEMARVTRRGGQVLVLVPNKYYIWYQWGIKIKRWRRRHHQYSYERALSAAEVHKAFLQCGLTDVRASGCHVHPGPSFIVGKLGPLTNVFQKLCRPLESSSRVSWLKAILSLEIAVWGTKT